MSVSARVWAWPTILNALMATGLAGALVSDKWGDPWAWFALSLPLAVLALLLLRRPRNQNR